MSTTPAMEWWRPAAPASPDTVAPCAPYAQWDLAPSASDASVPGRLSFLALMVFTFVLLVSPQSFLPALAPLHLALLAAGVAISAYMVERLSRDAVAIQGSADLRIALALAVWAALTVPLSLWPSGSIDYLIDPFAKSLILFWLLSRIVVTKERMQWTALCLVLMTTPVALTGVWHLLSGVFVAQGITPGFGRIAGYEAPLTSNPNDLALTLNLILPLGVGLLLSVRKPIVRAVVLAIVALDVLAIIATFSRGGFLTLLTILFAYMVRLSRRHPAVFVVPLLLLLCIPLLPSGYLDQMSTITHIGLDPTGSAQERRDDLVAAGRLVLSNPVTGAGIGMNALAMNAERGATWRMVHNVYLQYAVELGVPGLVLFLILLGRCIRKAGAARRQAALVDRDGVLFRLAEAAQIGLIAFAVAAIFHPVGYNLYFFYLAGLTLGLEKAVGSRDARQGASIA